MEPGQGDRQPKSPKDTPIERITERLYWICNANGMRTLEEDWEEKRQGMIKSAVSLISDEFKRGTPADLIAGGAGQLYKALAISKLSEEYPEVAGDAELCFDVAFDTLNRSQKSRKGK